MKRKIIWVNYQSRGRWVVVMRDVHIAGPTPKKQATREAVRFALAKYAELGDVFTIKIRAKDGTIREERTIPRSSDPRGSRG